ncbi:MAG: alpha/beta fold hydrolase [Deltaproteobacteria bacterium]|nr:alpha/beta fold hydrolase [Deltaproteobacteria bacterium]
MQQTTRTLCGSSLLWMAAAVLALSPLNLTGCGNDGETMGPGVSSSQRTYVDTSRQTPATTAYKGAATRTLRTRLWTPGTDERLPLLLMAHGFGGTPEKFDAFARSIAAAGYVVAAPAFPLTNEDAPGGHEVGLRDFIHQPADLSFVLDQLLAANEVANDPLHDRIDPGAVSVLGHSLGGVTTIALTRKNCCRDARIKATILAAAVADLVTAFGIDPIATGPPTLILHGTADKTIPYATAAPLYSAIAAPRYLVGLFGADHSEALESQLEPPITARAAAQQATAGFLDALFRSRTAEWQQIREQLTASGNTVLADPG